MDDNTVHSFQHGKTTMECRIYRVDMGPIAKIVVVGNVNAKWPIWQLVPTQPADNYANQTKKKKKKSSTRKHKGKR